MRRTLYGAVLSASLLLPVVAGAMPDRIRNRATDAMSVSMPKYHPNMVLHQANNNGPEPSRSSTNGTGMLNGTDPGHVNGPGTAQTDLDTRGVLNDVQPGAMSAGGMGVPQERNPPPKR